MKKALEFKFPFFQWSDLDFYNCFASVYLYLENINDGRVNVKQERLCYFWKTLRGGTVLRHRWEGVTEGNPWSIDINTCTKMQRENLLEKDTDEVIDYTIGFSGYSYSKLTSDFKKHIYASIDAGKPVMARMKNTDHGSFRVITGYDGDALLCPDFSTANNPPDCDPVYDDIANLYVFGEKIKPKYTFIDVLNNIKKVMEYNLSEKLWDEYIQKFDYINEKLGQADIDEVKKRFQILGDTMNYTFNCHEFQQAFADTSLLQTLGLDVEHLQSFLSVVNGVGSATDIIHTRGWQGSALSNRIDWNKWNGDQDDFGLCSLAVQTLESIKECDLQILSATNDAIHILSELN